VETEREKERGRKKDIDRERKDVFAAVLLWWMAV